MSVMSEFGVRVEDRLERDVAAAWVTSGDFAVLARAAQWPDVSGDLLSKIATMALQTTGPVLFNGARVDADYAYGRVVAELARVACRRPGVLTAVELDSLQRAWTTRNLHLDTALTAETSMLTQALLLLAPAYPPDPEDSYAAATADASFTDLPAQPGPVITRAGRNY